MIQFHNVCKAYQKDSSALEDISLNIPKGDFVYLTGPSGPASRPCSNYSIAPKSRVAG